MTKKKENKTKEKKQVIVYDVVDGSNNRLRCCKTREEAELLKSKLLGDSQIIERII